MRRRHEVAPLPRLRTQASEAAWLAGTGAIAASPCKLVYASPGVKVR